MRFERKISRGFLLIQDLQHLFRCFLSSPLLEPAETKHNGNIYKRIVKTNTGVQSFFAGLYKAFWATKSQIRQIGVC